jgi:hypothetical protein
MRWTTRLKRHGGLAALQARRKESFTLLAKAEVKAVREGRSVDHIKEARKWLEWHHLRTL